MNHLRSAKHNRQINHTVVTAQEEEDKQSCQNTDTNKVFPQIPATNKEVSQMPPIREVDMEVTETWDAADILTYQIL